MLRKKKTIAQVIATAMIASTFTINVSALEQRSAISSTSSLAGNDRYETAIKISENGWTTSNNAILINGEKGLVDALTATPYASLKDAPILITYKEKLHPSTKARLIKMGVKNVDIVGGAGSVSEAVVNELKSMKITVNRLGGSSRYETGLKVAQAMDKISDVSRVAVVNGEKGLPDAVSIAAPAAKNKMPIILANPNNGLDAATKAFIAGEDIYRSYVVGQTASVSETIKNSLPGTKVRLGGTDRHDTNAKVLSEFYTQSSLANVYIAKSGQVRNESELVDALAVGVLAAKNDVPVLLAGKNLGATQQSYLKDKKISKITEIGQGVPSTTVQEIKNTQVEAEAKVTGVTVENYKTIKISGSNLNLIDKSKIYLSGNSVSDYTVNSSGTQATIVFTSGFSSSNTVRITSNLGNTTSHSFSYSSEISSVEATTDEVKSGTNDIQYLAFSVNKGQKKTIDELKSLGWKVEFKSGKAGDKIFYNGTVEGSEVSETGKLKLQLAADTYTYRVVITKGSTTYDSGLKAFTAVANFNNYSSIKSFDIVRDGVKLTSNSLVVNETANIANIVAIDKYNNDVEALNPKYISSNPSVISVDKTGKLTAVSSSGSATITVTSGGVSKNVTISARSGVRKASSMAISDSTTVKLVGAQSKTLTATVKDQYGDLYKGKTLDISKINDRTTTSNELAKVTYGDAKSVTGTTDEKGQVKINIAGNANLTGDGTLVFKEGTSNLATISLYIRDTAKATNWRLEKESGKDATIDVYDTTDNALKFIINGYTNDGYLVDSETITTVHSNNGTPVAGVYSIKIFGTDGIIDNAGAGSKEVTLTALKEGTVTVKAYNGTTELNSMSLTVKDSTPKLSKINLNEISTITKAGEFKAENLLDITIVDGKKVVSGVTLTGKLEQVYLDDSDENMLKLYTTKDDHKTKNYIGTIDLTGSFGTGKTVSLSAGDKGSIVCRIYQGTDNTTTAPLNPKTINVDIPAQ